MPLAEDLSVLRRAKGPVVLANDVAELIGNEPELTAQLRPGTFVGSMQNRHSYESAGPRFKKFAGEVH